MPNQEWPEQTSRFKLGQQLTRCERELDGVRAENARLREALERLERAQHAIKPGKPGSQSRMEASAAWHAERIEAAAEARAALQEAACHTEAKAEAE